jgi:predicted nuclease of predicted toxin-antitoxin system
VKDAGLIGANDAAIAAAARREDRVILTRDADFRMIGADPGGVQVLRLGMGNANNAALLQWIAPRLPDAVRRFAQGERFVELL